MRVDQSRQRCAIGALADVPVMQMCELAQGGRLAGIRHARQAEIDAVRQDHGEKRVTIIGRSTGAAMREAFGKAGPAIDLQQQIGDLHARQAVVDHAPHVLCTGRGYGLERRDDEPAGVEPYLGQFPLPGERRDLFDRGIEAGTATGNEGIEVGVDRQRQRPALA